MLFDRSIKMPDASREFRISTLPEILERLNTHRHDLEAMGVTRIGVFGSFARGNNRPDSDIDILIGYRRGFTLFDLTRVSDYLEGLLGRETDVVEIKSALRRPYFKRVVDEAVYVY